MTNKEKIDYVFAHYNKVRNRIMVKYNASLFTIVSVIIALIYSSLGTKIKEEDGGVLFIIMFLSIIALFVVYMRASYYSNYTKVTYNEKYNIFGIYNDGDNYCFGIDLFYRTEQIGEPKKYANDLDKTAIQEHLLSIYERLKKEEDDIKNKSEKLKTTDLTDLYNKAD